MPVSAKNTLRKSAEFLSKELGEPYHIDDVESLIEEGRLVACAYDGGLLVYIFGDSYRDLKNEKGTLVANSREELLNGMEAHLRLYGPTPFKQDNIVILKEELDAFIASQGLGRPSFLQPIETPAALRSAILKALLVLGYDPLSLPVPRRGIAGVRKEVRDYLESKGVHITESKFRKAYQALRNDDKIRDN